MTEPDEDFVKFLAHKVYDGAFVESVKKQFTKITIDVFNQFVEDRINERFTSLAKKPTQMPEHPVTGPVVDIIEIPKQPLDNTKEELEGFYIAKAILRELVDPGRIFIRNQQRYAGIILDNSFIPHQ